MSYELRITDTAKNGLRELVNNLPDECQDAALDGVESALHRLASSPRRGTTHLGRPDFRFEIDANGARCFWGCSYKFGEDERTIFITQIYGVRF